MERGSGRGAGAYRLSPRHRVQCMLELGRLTTPHHMQGQEDASHQPPNRTSHRGSYPFLFTYKYFCLSVPGKKQKQGLRKGELW